MSSSLRELAARVGYLDLRSYLAARGWTNVPSRRDYAAIYRSPGYRSPGDGDVEVQIPLDTKLADYADAMFLAARRLADFEGRPVEQVLRDLLQPRSDTLRYALADDALRTGTIDLLTGSSLTSGVVGRFVGKVLELSGAPNPAGNLEGDVVLQVQTDDQLLKVRVTLDPDAYREAGLAHFEQRYVSVRGQLHRGRRTHVLRNPSEFAVLPP